MFNWWLFILVPSEETWYHMESQYKVNQTSWGKHEVANCCPTLKVIVFNQLVFLCMLVTRQWWMFCLKCSNKLNENQQNEQESFHYMTNKKQGSGLCQTFECKMMWYSLIYMSINELCYLITLSSGNVKILLMGTRDSGFCLSFLSWSSVNRLCALKNRQSSQRCYDGLSWTKVNQKQICHKTSGGTQWM